MDWPVALVTELAARRCIVFLGAGASANCPSADGTCTPPLWPAFLTQLKEAMPRGVDTTSIDDLIAKERFLDAAEVIVAKVAAADFARVVRQSFVVPRYSPSLVHEAVLEIDPKILVTTNYDDIYDNYCRTGMAHDGYNVCKYYDQHLVNDLRSPVRLVIKAHGCVSDPSRIVLTRSQYFRERQGHGAFYQVMDALFLTNTVFFVGYSLSDPDIQLILENSNIAARSSHSHYAFISDDLHPDIEQAAAGAYNIRFIKHPRGDHAEAEKYLKGLAQEVIQSRIANPS
ncbi:MAG: SIR2 family protein [Pseudomonadota bacterium]